ncbi:hypothetical protein LEMLEM_LOCUS15841, partial [Lemmus lemmus]
MSEPPSPEFPAVRPRKLLVSTSQWLIPVSSAEILKDGNGPSKSMTNIVPD